MERADVPKFFTLGTTDATILKQTVATSRRHILLYTPRAPDIDMELTDQQKERIQENRLRAQQLLAKKRATEADEALKKCEFFSNCRSDGIDLGLFDSFSERVCSVCKLNNPSYELITRSEAISGYLISDDTLRMMKYQTRDNPHNPGWTPMKLFLRKHVTELAVKRFGSLEELERVKKEREAQRFEKNLDRTNEVLGSAAKEMWGLMNDEGGAVYGATDSNISEKSDKQDRKRPSAKETGQKKKKSALNNLVGIIKGSGT
jgi:DNA repair protein